MPIPVSKPATPKAVCSATPIPCASAPPGTTTKPSSARVRCPQPAHRHHPPGRASGQLADLWQRPSAGLEGRRHRKRKCHCVAPLGLTNNASPPASLTGVVLTGRFRLAYGGIGQGHEYISRLVGRGDVYRYRTGAFHSKQLCPPPEFTVLKAVLKIWCWG
ncbi:hypothetical protein D3C84_337820 [compost metagenome]